METSTTRKMFATRLTSELLSRLRKYSRESGIKQNELIRQGLELVLPSPGLEVRQNLRYTGGREFILDHPRTLADGIRIVDEYNRRAGKIDAFELWHESSRVYPETDESSMIAMRRLRFILTGVDITLKSEERL